MNSTMAAGMEEATRLTRAGKLTEATALIQRLLNGGSADASPRQSPGQPPEPGHAGPTIEADYVVLEVGTGPGPRPDTGPDASADLGSRKPRAAGLGETLRRLKEMARQSRPAPMSDPLPEGASFKPGTHTGAGGSLDYRLYVPARRTEGGMPLMVMLHGCTQTPEDFAVGTRMNALAEEHGFLVVYPAQCQRANAQRCWNWFSPADQQRDRGEPALLAGLVRDIVRTHPVDPRRIYVAGLSAGGAAAAILAEAYPDLFAAVAVHSGLPPGAAHDMPSAFAAMRQGPPCGTAAERRGTGASQPVPAIVFHGDRDTTVNVANGTALAQRFRLPELDTVDRSERSAGGKAASRTVQIGPDGRTRMEHWTLHGAGHAWSGGSPNGSYTDPTGVDASRETIRFVLQHRLPD